MGAISGPGYLRSRDFIDFLCSLDTNPSATPWERHVRKGRSYLGGPSHDGANGVAKALMNRSFGEDTLAISRRALATYGTPAASSQIGNGGVLHLRVRRTAWTEPMRASARVAHFQTVFLHGTLGVIPVIPV